MLLTSKIACLYVLIFLLFLLVGITSLLGFPIFSFWKHSRMFLSSIIQKVTVIFLVMDLKFIMLAGHVLQIWKIRLYVFLELCLFPFLFVLARITVGQKLDFLIFGSFCFILSLSSLCLVLFSPPLPNTF